MNQKNKSEILKYPAFQRFRNTELQLVFMWSDKLNQYMVLTEDGIYFQDGIVYPVQELACIKGFSDSMLKAQHAARKVFGAELKILG